jgi:hypothetical protein
MQDGSENGPAGQGSRESVIADTDFGLEGEVKGENIERDLCTRFHDPV